MLWTFQESEPQSQYRADKSRRKLPIIVDSHRLNEREEAEAQLPPTSDPSRRWILVDLQETDPAYLMRAPGKSLNFAGKQLCVCAGWTREVDDNFRASSAGTEEFDHALMCDGTGHHRAAHSKILSIQGKTLVAWGDTDYLTLVTSEGDYWQMGVLDWFLNPYQMEGDLEDVMNLPLRLAFRNTERNRVSIVLQTDRAKVQVSWEATPEGIEVLPIGSEVPEDFRWVCPQNDTWTVAGDQVSTQGLVTSDDLPILKAQYQAYSKLLGLL